MQRSFFMAGDMAMVEIVVDPSNTVVRPATAEEIAVMKPPEKPKKVRAKEEAE